MSGHDLNVLATEGVTTANRGRWGMQTVLWSQEGTVFEDLLLGFHSRLVPSLSLIRLLFLGCALGR